MNRDTVINDVSQFQRVLGDLAIMYPLEPRSVLSDEEVDAVRFMVIMQRIAREDGGLAEIIQRQVDRHIEDQNEVAA
jgi:hypothetical protein